MRSRDQRKDTTAGGAALALALSSLFLAGCSSDPETPASATETSPSISTQASPSAPAASAPASPPTSAPASPSASPPPAVPAPAVQTAEDARKIIADYHENNADLAYTVFDNGDGTFDVKVTSVSIAAQGGTGTAGIYTVEPSGNFVLK